MMNKNAILEWTATAVTVGGAIATALGKDPLNIYLFNIGSVLWLWWAMRTNKMSIAVVNIGLLTVYVYGLYIRG
jgi:hypothetical protein